MLQYAILSLMFSSVIALDTNYEYVTELKNWYQANEYCKRKGMELLEINSDKEYNMTIDTIHLNCDKCLWTSGSDLGEQGTWVWMSSGEKISYTEWLFNNPDNYLGNEHCLQLQPRWFSYNDAECTNQCYFMCEQKSKTNFHLVYRYGFNKLE